MMNTSTTKIATLNSLPANNQCGLLKLNIHTATGGHIELNMSEKETVSSLKWRLSRKLKISCEKMSLLFKDRPLKEGSLQDNLVTDNSKILLLPNMESGMTFQRPDVGVIQGLENLTESQVNDFLSGRAPLLLVMKLGDHMMFVQLQLSTASCGQGSQKNSSVDAKEKAASTGPLFNSAALAELGHNLSQKLREFSQLSTHQKVSEHSTIASPTSSPAGPTTTSNNTSNNNSNNNSNSNSNSNSNNNSNNNTSTYSVSKNVPATGPVTHPPQPSNPETNRSDNHNSNLSQSPSNTSMTSGSSCNPSNTCATTTASPTPASRTCPTTGEQIPGAIIESMHHIGQGVYSGTFSGTLDPSLQDNDGKPKRNIGTIIHILNDLLGATPQYRPQNLPHATEKLAVDNCSHKNSEQSQALVSLSDEDNALRGKVKDLQMKMEEKRMRRQARRDAKAPYQCPGPRQNTTFTFPTSTTTTTFALNSNADYTSNPDICSTDSDLSVFTPQHPECTVTEMEIGEESTTDGEGKNREIEMTAMPTPATATTTTTSTASGSTKATEASSYANSSLEQESVLV